VVYILEWQSYVGAMLGYLDAKVLSAVDETT
jgi:hypothetical protein